MNAMSHTLPNALAIEQGALAKQITSLVPGFMTASGASADAPMPNMPMDHSADMPMNMPLPENTLPMMTGAGPHGNIEMGGMFTVVKIRANLAPGDYRDPGWYKAPGGSVAYLWQGDPPDVVR